ncbi:MAG: lipoate--protein ligase family protein [Paludibacteraceae bacterium]|nr:lipoate--protein ligase family protein [Paludibacteraceae bacterium]
MKQLIVPQHKRLSWYLAAEEYIGRQTDRKEEIIFFWWVRPTVIYGRHQVLENEVNLDYCHAHNVDLVQRKSGGGCVYADEGNLMTSFITPSAHSEQVFQQYLATMADALRQLGVPTVTTEHNDILVQTNEGTHKISGNACYALPSGTIVHGTLLYNVDFEALQQAITPSQAKLAKHGVESVRQRVMNIAPLVQVTNVEELSLQLANELCDGHIELTAEDIEAINEIERQNY